MGKKYLIDSNVIIEYLAKVYPANIHGKISEIIDTEFNISVINKIEVLGHPLVNDELIKFIDLANVFEADSEIVSQTISIRKKYKIKIPDAVIAATAIVHNFVLLTRNVNDFKAISELKVENPS